MSDEQGKAMRPFMFKLAVIFSLIIILGWIALALPAQDHQLAPRGAVFEGTADTPSPSGQYIVTFPPPNECVILGPIKADSRTMALYRAVSKGGFKLKPSTGGLSVWTLEEWTEAKIDIAKMWPNWARDFDKHCGRN